MIYDDLWWFMMIYVLCWGWFLSFSPWWILLFKQSTEASRPADLPWVRVVDKPGFWVWYAMNVMSCLFLVVVSFPFVGDLYSYSWWFTHGVTIGFSISLRSYCPGRCYWSSIQGPWETGWEWKVPLGHPLWATEPRVHNRKIDMFSMFLSFSLWTRVFFHEFCCQLLLHAQGSKNVPYRNHKLTMLMQAWIRMWGYTSR